MTEWTKTLLFVAAAGASLALAAGTRTFSRPSTTQEFERVGEPFFSDFQDPLTARSLQVVTYDDETSVIKEFDVAWGKSGWTISPYGYPADAKDQLEKTAASVVGIERERFVSRREGDYERYGVIDPLNEDPTKLKGRGRRITLKDEKDQVLADYILGKAVEGRDGYFYVRRPKEKETYAAKVDLNLSTRFADWIEADLLSVAASDLRKIEILDYSFDQDRGAITGRDRNVLLREEDFGPWKLEGLDEATEQVNTAAVTGMTQVLDDLKIIGVRPKPQGLNPDLSLDSKVIDNQLSLQLLGESLAGKGFLLLQGRDGKLQMVAKEGQLVATTSAGVVYDLYFGDQFTGSEYELEFGDEQQDGDAPKRLTKTDSKKTETGRYVFIAARLDQAALGDAPQPPSEPAPPAEDAGEEEKKKAADAAAKADADYQAAKRSYDTKVADAQKRVDDLNDRFEKWFYVISTDNFKDLRLSREGLVEPKKETTASPAPSTPAGTPAAAESTSPVEAPKPPATTSPDEVPAAE